MDFSANVQICEKKTQKNTDIEKNPSLIHQTSRQMSSRQAQSIRVSVDFVDLQNRLSFGQKIDKLCVFLLSFEFVHSILHVAEYRHAMTRFEHP